MNVIWKKCGDDGHWCSLENLDLGSITASDGVYIIWHQGNPAKVVRVGQGNIAARLGRHRADPEILAYRDYGKLRVTWASVARKADRDGIEKYLAQQWAPLVGDAFPVADPIPVNSPWAA